VHGVTLSVAPPTVGPLLRQWRLRRRRSQMDLALDVGVSTRHLSFVETGRSRPSPELLLALADRLEVPLRERNTFLLAAGYAPRFRQTALDDASMAGVRAALQRLLERHDPYPGAVIDRTWNVVDANAAAGRLLAALPASVLGPPPNVFRVCLHPDGLARHTGNFAEWGTYLWAQLRRLEQLTGDPRVVELAAEVGEYPTVRNLAGAAGPEVSPPMLLVPWQLRLGDDELSLFTTLTSFGTPVDITLDELAVELFYPADTTTERLLAAGRGG
jgi:transcriptional regulator with XRE-family HTH domain